MRPTVDKLFIAVVIFVVADFKVNYLSLPSTLAQILKGEVLLKSGADDGSFLLTQVAFENVVDDVIAFGLLIIVLLKTVLELASVLLTRVSTRVVQALSLGDES